VSVIVRANSTVGALCVETRLKQLGFTGQTPDDFFNATSVNALRLFQIEVGLSASGVGDSATLIAMGIWRSPPAATCTVSVVVRPGSVIGVRCLETRLRQLGFTAQTPDDYFNSTSVAALQAYQRSAGLLANGIAAQSTLQSLAIWRAPAAFTCFVSYNVRPGSVAGARCVETRLRQLGFTGQTPDDYFNSTSVQALRSFQHSAGLLANGIATSKTSQALGIWRGVSAPTCTVGTIVRVGSSSGVRCLETRLRQFGLTSQSPDDTFNSTSVNALRMFQFSAGLATSGVGDVKTLQALSIYKPTGGFSVIPPGGALPSDAECAARVTPSAENRPENVTFNNTRGDSAHNEIPRVNGNFVGTTDEIIQWAACKHGLDINLARAQAVWCRSGVRTTPSATSGATPRRAYPVTRSAPTAARASARSPSDCSRCATRSIRRPSRTTTPSARRPTTPTTRGDSGGDASRATRCTPG